MESTESKKDKSIKKGRNIYNIKTEVYYTDSRKGLAARPLTLDLTRKTINNIDGFAREVLRSRSNYISYLLHKYIKKREEKTPGISTKLIDPKTDYKNENQAKPDTGKTKEEVINEEKG